MLSGAGIDRDAELVLRVAVTLDTAAASVPVGIEFDRQLTVAMAKYLRELHEGRVDPRTLGFRMNVTPEDGTVQFVKDIYGHDARLDRMLRGRHD